MCKLTSVVIFSVLLTAAKGDILLGDLPPEVISDVIGILTQGVNFQVGDCTENIQQTQNHFMLYTRSNPNGAIFLNPSNLNEIQENKQIVFITHGWIGNGSDKYSQNMKNAYLNRTDCNVIVVDWSVYADVDYPTAYCNTREVGKQLGDLLCEINATQHVDLETVHLVGHSLGAHISGFAGDHVRSTCTGVVGRITGLDPAGPGFQGLPISQRLDASDAKFVDIIHTNEGEFGYYGATGHADFYVNCGAVQPGCSKVNTSNTTELRAASRDYIGCPHYRSVLYFTESINSDRFKAISCPTCPSVCVPNSLNPTTIIMGEDCSRNPPSESYWLTTNSQPPYARG